MGPLKLDGLPENAVLLVDTAPIIYLMEKKQPELTALFLPLAETHDEGRVRIAVTTVTIAEVLTKVIAAGDEVLAARYKTAMKSWFIVEFDLEIAEITARLRAKFPKLKTPDAIIAASAIAIGADALATHDRDFSAINELRVLGITNQV